MKLPSPLLEHAVDAFAGLPGIGRKTALRLALHILKQDTDEVHSFLERIRKMHEQIRYCRECFNISEDDLCTVCQSTRRDRHMICVVENFRDIISIESTGEYNGLFHVLGGLISPIDGIGPSSLKINELRERCEREPVKEVILALNPNLAGDTTAFYISKKMNPSIRLTTLSRGVAFGGEIEYADEITLMKSMENRIPLEKTLPDE